MIRKFIDAHCLVGRDFWLSTYKPELAHENMLAEYSKVASTIAKVFEAIIMPFPSSEDGSFLVENATVFELSKRYLWAKPIFAFNYHSKKNFEDICRRLDNGETQGLVVWPIVCNLDLIEMIDNKRFRYLIANFDCWFTVHVGAGNEANIKRVNQLNRYCPNDAIDLAEAFPQAKFNLSHLLRISDSALKRAEHLGNILIDISGISTHHRWIEHGSNVFPACDADEFGLEAPETILRRLMGRAGLQNKLVFGSQYPFGKWYNFGLEDELKLVYNTGLADDAMDKLLYKNFERFFESRRTDAR